MVGSLDLHAPRFARRIAASLAGAAVAMLAGATASVVADEPGQPSRTLELRVLDARTGRPEPGVTVRVRIPARAEGRTDADGRFRIVGTDREFTVVILGPSKPGFVPVEVNWDNARAQVAAPVPREHTIKREPASTIGGAVRDERGRPIAGARVSLSIPVAGNREPGEPRVDPSSFQTPTDADGRWRCDLARARLEKFSITIEHPDYALERHPNRQRAEDPAFFAVMEAGRAVLVLEEKCWAYELPSIWLIGPDGRVVARDLKGAAIKEAVAGALRGRTGAPGFAVIGTSREVPS